MNKAKTWKMKLIYVIAAVAMLAMLIPAMALPVSAAGTIKMFLVDPLNNTGVMGNDLIPPGVEDSGYNVTGSVVEIQVSGTTVTSWAKNDLQGTSTWVMPAAPTTELAVRLSGVWGETDITATTPDGPLSINKKWGQIKNTVITGNQSVFLTWNETAKYYEGAVAVKDTVNGSFIGKDGPFPDHAVQGVIFNWYLVPGDAVVPQGPAEAPVLMGLVEGLGTPFFTQFGLPVPPPAVFPPSLQGTNIQTVSGPDGASSVGVYSNGAETVQVVVVPQYPGTPQLEVVTEVTTVNFKVRQLEVVPQVRWVGEKIVLEKNFEDGYIGYPVKFTSESAKATLEGIGNFTSADQNTVETTVDSNGLASCILKSSEPGEYNVELALYDKERHVIENQHAFTVYYLKFAGVTLGNVIGKRDGHNSGLWTPPNPWDPDGMYDPANPTPDLGFGEPDDLNVSEDALLRARVRGWFVNSNMNPARPTPESVDTNGDGTMDLVIPAWAWVLPDDWANPALMGAAGRIHWDIMDNPFDSVVSTNPLGDYGRYAWDNTVAPSVYKVSGPIVAAYEVVGPFSPGIELMTPTGWLVPNPRPDPDRQYQTVVPNGVKEWWDAPMPPAKITFKILNENYIVINGTQEVNVGKSGFFKPAMKTDIYYWKIFNPARPQEPPTIVYTNPFYCIMVPAHQAIPAFGNNEAYDWATFGIVSSDYPRDPQGPYPFWTFLNVDEDPAVPTANAQYPTIASVYSDNHGEAMVWLNGDWNLNLSFWSAKGGADVPLDMVVGETQVRAVADYPYARGHANYLSNSIEKIWHWGGLVLGAYSHQFADESATSTDATRMVLTAGNYTVTGGTFPYQDGTSDDKVVWIWVTDRDGKQAGVLGAEVLWNVGVKGPYILTTANGMISNYNDITRNTMLVNGFLAGTSGVILNGAARTLAASELKAPNYAHAYVLSVPTLCPDGVTPMAGDIAKENLWKSLTAEEALFYKFFNKSLDPLGLNPKNFAVAAIDIKDASQSVDCTVDIQIFSEDFGFPGTPIGMVQYATNVNFANAYPIDDAIKSGDANMDDSVNMGDVTVIEKIILKLKAPNAQADVNCNGTVDMGDVVKLERKLLGLK